MANLLDEMNGPVNQEGRDINVIEKRIPVTIGFGSVIFEIALWVLIPIGAAAWYLLLGQTQADGLKYLLCGCIGGVLPGIIFLFMKISAKNYFQQLEQRIQAEASNIDNYLEQRVQILQNVVGLVNRAVDLDKDVMKSVASLRSGGTIVNEENRSSVDAKVSNAFSRIAVQFEAYPELQAHNAIADAMQQNNYLQREITAARTVYNSRVTQWNTDIFDWPTKMIVAARQGYTTRIPFSVSAEVKAQARSKFF